MKYSLIYLGISALFTSLNTACKKENTKPANQSNQLNLITTSGTCFSGRKHLGRESGFLNKANSAPVGSYNLDKLNKTLAQKKNQLEINNDRIFHSKVEVFNNIRQHNALFEKRDSKDALLSHKKAKKMNHKENKKIDKLSKDNLKFLAEIADIEKKMDDYGNLGEL